MKKQKTKNKMPDGFKLFLKWLFLVIGVPSLVGIFLYISIQNTFETATSSWQIFIGFCLIIVLFVYEYFSIKYLVDETKEYFGG